MGKKVMRTRNPTFWEKITGKARPTRPATFFEKLFSNKAVPARPAAPKDRRTTPVRKATLPEKLRGEGIPIRKPTWLEDFQDRGFNRPKTPGLINKSRADAIHQESKICQSCGSKYYGDYCANCNDDENYKSRPERKLKYLLVRTTKSANSISRHILTFKSRKERDAYLEDMRFMIDYIREKERWELEDDLGWHEEDVEDDE